jgi:hypothetical protein
MSQDQARDLALVTNATVALQTDEATVSRYWNRYVIPQAVDFLIATTCFGWRNDKGPEWTPKFYQMLDAVRQDPANAIAVRLLQAEINPDHRHCFKLWHNDGDSGFYCLGPINRCVNCGAEWTGVVNTSWQTGKLLKGQCPSCGEQWEPLFGQRALWREMVTNTVGDQLAVFKSQWVCSSGWQSCTSMPVWSC